MDLFFDTETSGFYKKNLPATHPDQAWIMQLGVMLSDADHIYAEYSLLIKAIGRSCNPGAQKVHGISVEMCDAGGQDEDVVNDLFYSQVKQADLLICHNYNFDINLVCSMIERNDCRTNADFVRNIPHYCTMLNSTDMCNIPGRYGKPKWPKLQELHKFLFGCEFTGAHSALDDVRATRRCYYAMKERGL